ncbi:hypothetical protein TELCIR_03409 [Teladorsagia circumcincta]|uniref:UV-stimulated scaffold protein A C-terminal domain-containing protein n=1 Tax=Teladorsagia circumcincta TaxID=45464 RepID=A0A2G9UWE1_TELCI|nr:hypothetical protein TELCIR_03409 [Teladorsagia circumcincta]
MDDDSSRILRVITTKLVNEAVNNSKKNVTTESQDFKRLKREVRDNEHAVAEYVEYLFISLKAVDFDSASAELLAERLRKEAEDRRSAELSQKVVAHVRRKLDEVKDDIERCIASADTALSILVPVFCTDFDETTTKNSDSTSDPSTAQELQEKQEEVKPAIPVVSYGLDLKYWGEQRSEAPIPRNNADCHRFWRAPEDDDRPVERESTGEIRVITWIGEPQRAERRCKARLPNGKLCPRMDLRKCPLHGIIVDRDSEGFPLEEVDATELSAVQAEREQQEEQDYLRDLEAGTGKSFVSKPKKKKVQESTVRERLEKKLLNPRTIKRVSAALDAARKARLQRKFGDQFAHLPSK